MTRSIYASVVGNGKTTRNNIEALLGDFLEAVDELTLVLEIQADGSTTTSTAGLWIDQFAQELDVPVKYATNVYSYIDENCSDDLESVKLFVLWDDDDPACQQAVAYAKTKGISVFDLTDGLVRIDTENVDIDAIAQPVMPVLETENVQAAEPSDGEEAFTFSNKPNIFDEMAEEMDHHILAEDIASMIDAMFDLDEEDDYEDDVIYAAIEHIGVLLARAFAGEVIRLLKDNKDGKAE